MAGFWQVFLCLYQLFKKAFSENSEVLWSLWTITLPNTSSMISIQFGWVQALDWHPKLGEPSWPPDVFALARLTVKVEPAFSTAYDDHGVGQQKDPTSESVTCAVATPKLPAYSTNQYERSTSNISVSLGKPLNAIMPSTTPKTQENTRNLLRVTMSSW